MTLVISHDDACDLAALIKRVAKYENVNGNSPALFLQVNDSEGLILELKAKPGPDGVTAIYVRERAKPSVKKTWVSFLGHTNKDGINLLAYSCKFIINWNHVPGLPPEMVRKPLVMEVGE